MKHLYTEEDGLSGTWMTEGDRSAVYCHWWWDDDARTLFVDCGITIQRWDAPTVAPAVMDVVIANLPKTALEIALVTDCKIEQER